MSRPESEFPTIRDLREALSKMIERGFGDLAVQIVVAPDSTMQAIARVTAGDDYDGRAALMIDIAGGTDGRMSVSLISTERLQGCGPTTVTQ